MRLGLCVGLIYRNYKYKWGLGFGDEARESWVYPVRDEQKHKEG